MKKLLFVLLLSLPLWAQTKTLSIFSKPTCNNCKYTKYMLQKNGIAFSDFSLDNPHYAAEMLNRLKSAGYTGPIHLPVIFQNDSMLLHPEIPYDDSTLFFIVEEIISQKQLYTSGSNPTEIKWPENGNGDCVMEEY